MGSLCTSQANTSSSPPPQILADYQNLIGQAQTVGASLTNLPAQYVAPPSWEQIIGENTINQAPAALEKFINSGGSQISGGYGVASGALNFLPNEYSAINAGLGLMPGAAGLVGSGASTVSGALPYYSAGAGAVGSGLNTLGSALPYYGMGAGLAAQSVINPITSGSIQQYMSPYLNDVVNSTENAFANSNAIQANQLTSSAILGGNAFGGDRAGVAQGVLAGQQQAAEAPVIAGLENTGYGQAVQEAMGEQGLQQSAAGLYSGFGSGVAGVGSAMGTLGGVYGSLGSGVVGAGSTLGQLGGLTGQLGVETGQLGGDYGALAGTTAGIGSSLAGIGTQTASLGPAEAGALTGTGAQQIAAGASTQQAYQQALLNAQYQQYLNQIGVTGLSYQAPIIEGTGSISGGTSSTQTTPSLFSLLSGHAHGGRTFDDGGSVSDDYSNSLVGYDALAGALSGDQSANQLAAGLLHLANGGSTNGALDVNIMSGPPSVPLIPNTPSAMGNGPPKPPTVPPPQSLLSTLNQVNGAAKTISGINNGLGSLFGGPSNGAGDAGMGGWTASMPSIGIGGGGLAPNLGAADSIAMGGGDSLALGALVKRGGRISEGGRIDPSSQLQGFAYGGMPMGFGGFGMRPQMPTNTNYAQQIGQMISPGTRMPGLGGGGGFGQGFGIPMGQALNRPPQGVMPIASPGLATPFNGLRARGGRSFADGGSPDDDVSINGTDDPGLDVSTVPSDDSSGDAGLAAINKATDPKLIALQNATYGQESSFGRNPSTSSAGAIGPMQIEPQTWRQYALPGEDIRDPVANRRVGNRILSAYYDQYGGDPARAAVAYFSGPGNVAPPDSPTPWKRNVADPSGKTVSSYVGDILGRMNDPNLAAMAFNGQAAPTGGLASPNYAPSTASPATSTTAPSQWHPDITQAILAGIGGMFSGHGLIGGGILGGLGNLQQQQEQHIQQVTADTAVNRLNAEKENWQSEEKYRERVAAAQEQNARTNELLRIAESRKPQTVGYDKNFNPVLGIPNPNGPGFLNPLTLKPIDTSNLSGTPQTAAPPLAQGESPIEYNKKLVAAGPYDYSQGAPHVEQGWELPEPTQIYNRSPDALKTDAIYYMETGKLPQGGTGFGNSPLARAKQNYSNAVENYGVALGLSRGYTPDQIAEMRRTSPGMLRFVLGADGRSTVALGTAVRHLDTLKQLANAWNAYSTDPTGNNLQALNKVKAAISAEFGADAATNLQAAGTIVGPEIIKAIGVAGAGTAEEREKAGKPFGTTSSPEQLLGAVAVTQKLLGGQLEGRERQALASGLSEQQFKNLIGERPYELLKGSSPVEQKSALPEKDQRALDWANANPKDPRATKIKQRLGIQ